MAGKSKRGHRIDEEGGRVKHPAVLARGVIRREDVVVVVESLAAGAERHPGVLSRVDVLVVRPVAPQVRDAVDRPGNVQDSHVAQDAGREVSCPRALTPEVHRYHGRHHEAKQHHGWHVQPAHHYTLELKALREMQTLRAGCSKAEPKFFALPQTP